MNLSTRIRALVLGEHTTATVWTGPRTGNKAQNGQLRFREAEWQHFRSLLTQESDTRELLSEVISFCEAVLPTIADQDSSECELCGAPDDEPCEDDCLAGRGRILMGEAQDILWRAGHEGLILEE